MCPKTVKNVSNIHPKVASQTVLQAESILAPTWLHFGLVLAPKLKPSWHQVAPKMYPESNQKIITLRIANLCQLGPNLAPTWPQLGSNLAQLGPNLGPTWPSSRASNSTWPQLGPGWRQLGQLGRNLPHLGPNLASDCDQVGPRWHK